MTIFPWKTQDQTHGFSWGLGTSSVSCPHLAPSQENPLSLRRTHSYRNLPCNMKYSTMHKWGSVKCCHIGQSKPFWRALYHVHIFMSKISFILIKAQTSSKLRFTRLVLLDVELLWWLRA
jgi:hypothetical protein